MSDSTHLPLPAALPRRRARPGAALLLALAAAAGSAGAAPTALPERLIVRFDDAASQRAAAAIQLVDAAGLDRINGERAAALGTALGMSLAYRRTTASGALVVDVPDGQTAAALARRLRGLAVSGRRVQQAEPDRVMEAFALPNDPELVNQWHYYGPADGQPGGLNAAAAWASATGAGATVAVIDTGYLDHPDLAGQVVAQYDFVSDATNAKDGNGRDADAHDPGDARTAGDCGGASASSSSWHGTHVAGTIAALTNNGIGVAGVAYDAKLVIARVLGKCGGYSSDIADAIVWSSGGSVPGVPANPRPANVINMSLGGQYACSGSTETQNAISSARSRGTTVVVAAGNSNADASGFTPAGCPGVIAVASVGPGGARAYYSNYGSVVAVAAPGGDQSQGTTAGVLSTSNSGTAGPATMNYRWLQGTSMASPHVAGAAALLYSRQPSITPDQVLAALKTSARAFPSTCSGCGSGIVDAAAALVQITPPDALTPGTPVADLAGSATSARLWTLAVPANAKALSITLTAGTGSAQLYLKRGAAPTATVYDCKAAASGATQTCAITGAVTAGTYWVAVRGVTDYSGYTLLANYTQSFPGTLSLNTAAVTVTEAATTVTVNVSRSGGADGAISVPIATANGTATAGSDYTAKSATLSWAAGDSASKSFVVSILNDTLPEATETFFVKLGTPTGGAALGAIPSTTVSIADDSDSQPGTLQFAATGYSVSEAGPTVTLSVKRVDGAKGVVGVSYATADDSALAGADYTAKTGTLSWANGDVAAKTFTVAITNDLIAEPVERFAVELSSPTGGATLGAIARVPVTITDNDTAPGALAFSASTASVNEGAGTVTLLVTRSGGSGGAVSVSYATANGSAMASAQYASTSGTLSWAAGDPSSKSITVPIIDDSAWAASRSFTLTLSAPTGGATLGSAKSATVSIVDNDNTPGSIGLSATGYSVGEAGGSLVVTLKRSGGNQGAVAVTLATADGSALAGADYTAKTVTVSWANGDSANKTVSIVIANDTLKEGAENFGLSLTNPTGGATLGTASATVTIVDND